MTRVTEAIPASRDSGVYRVSVGRQGLRVETELMARTEPMARTALKDLRDLRYPPAATPTAMRTGATPTATPPTSTSTPTRAAATPTPALPATITTTRESRGPKERRVTWAREARKAGPVSWALKVSRAPRERRVTQAIPGRMGLKGSRARGGGQAFEAQRGRQGHGERPAPEGQRGLRVETEKTARTEPMALTAREGRRAPVAGPVRRDPRADGAAG